MSARHVAEQTQGERQGPGQVADDLDGHHERRQPHDRSHEVPEIGLEALVLDPDVVVREEHHEGAGGRCVEIPCGSFQPGHEAHQVGEQNEEPEGGDEGEITPTIVPDHVVDQPVELLEHDLHEILHTDGDQGRAPGRRVAHGHQNDHGQPRVRDVVGDTGQAKDRRMLDRAHVSPSRLASAARI